MGRYLKLLEERREIGGAVSCAVSPNPCAVSPDDPTMVGDLPRLPRNRATAPHTFQKNKKDNDIKEDEYTTSFGDGKSVVEPQGGAQECAVSAVSDFEAPKIPPRKDAGIRHSTSDTRDPGPPSRPPDLQEVVAQFGGYSSITPEAWAEWDRTNAEWKHDRARYYSGLRIGLPAHPPKKTDDNISRLKYGTSRAYIDPDCGGP